MTLPPTASMLDQVIVAAREVGREEVMPRYLKVAHQRKVDGSLLTEADLAAQSALFKRLYAIAPHTMLGEEMTEAEQHAVWQLSGNTGSEGFWCVDPIDGTSNFVNGLPFFAISIALVLAGRTVLGVVYDPHADEVFSATEGGGAFLNGARLPLKLPPAVLDRCMAGIDLKRIDRGLAGRLAREHPFASQRNLGASTLDWCYVAAGRLHIYLHGGQKMWDYAAGWLILKEAGGVVCGLNGGDFLAGDPWCRSVLAAQTPELLAQWRDWVAARLQGTVA